MICIYFSKSKLYFAKLDYLEITKHLSGFPTRETECDSHSGTYPNWLAQAPGDPLNVIENEHSSRGRLTLRQMMSQPHGLRAGHRAGLAKAERREGGLLLVTGTAPWPPSLKTYLKTTSPESHALCALCIALQAVAPPPPRLARAAREMFGGTFTGIAPV